MSEAHFEFIQNKMKKATSAASKNQNKGTSVASVTKKPKTIKLQKKTRVTSLLASPHTRALSALHKKPSLLKGNQEHFLQVRVFEHLEFEMPEIYDLTYAIPNGGLRSNKTAGDMLAEGLKKGYPDTALDAARGIYHGFRCEIKTNVGTRTENQIEYADKLRAQGYCVVFCYGFEAVIAAFEEYWNLAAGGVMSQFDYRSKK